MLPGQSPTAMVVTLVVSIVLFPERLLDRFTLFGLRE
jgi:hypothetical protein